MNKFKKIIPFLLSSLFLHLLMAIIIEQLPENTMNLSSTQANTNKTLKINSIERPRNVGIKNGSKKHDIQGASKSLRYLDKNVDLSSLAPDIIADKFQPKNQKPKKKEKKSPIEFKFNASSKSEKIVQKKFLRKISPERHLDPVLNNSDFALNPEIPEGIDVNDLNSAEKVFYSFKKRTMEQYLASFVEQYQSIKKYKPKIKKKLLYGKHALSGRITFDKNGNIVTIKIIKSSQDDDIHDLFEETLKGIRKVPNPPKDLLTKSEQFSIFYILKIN